MNNGTRGQYGVVQLDNSTFWITGARTNQFYIHSFWGVGETVQFTETPLENNVLTLICRIQFACLFEKRLPCVDPVGPTVEYGLGFPVSHPASRTSICPTLSKTVGRCRCSRPDPRVQFGWQWGTNQPRIWASSYSGTEHYSNVSAESMAGICENAIMSA